MVDKIFLPMDPSYEERRSHPNPLQGFGNSRAAMLKIGHLAYSILITWQMAKALRFSYT
jgi:hypothetical protein